MSWDVVKVLLNKNGEEFGPCCPYPSSHLGGVYVDTYVAFLRPSLLRVDNDILCAKLMAKTNFLNCSIAAFLYAL
jgi:hypothetical protein